ncbi:MAG: hypothetical protein Q9169_007125 [Polycauliona sp. 2 TL-2023]
MAEPLSLAAGVIGVLTAAAQISSLLVHYMKNSRDAHRSARAVLTEVSDIRIILSHIQLLMLYDEPRARTTLQLLHVGQVVTIIAGCVLTFSELEKLLDGITIRPTQADDMRTLSRLNWARKEGDIFKLIQRLQNHKASLTLILTVLNG